MMRIGSLFSGIGGLELGLERAGVGHTVWQVEQLAFSRAVLAKHWPDVERFTDVRTVGAHNLAPVDVVCGGFPCQDVSAAGARAGLSGARSGLWYEFERVVSELRPGWVVVENVASGATLWVDAVTAGLEQLGYQVLPIPLSAADVGAPHLRKRLFLLAYFDRKSEPVGAEYAEVAGAPPTAADAVRARRARPGAAAQEQGRAGSTWNGWRTPEPDMVRVVHGVSARLDQTRPRIRALGNSVVPQCAEVVGYVLRLLAAPKIG